MLHAQSIGDLKSGIDSLVSKKALNPAIDRIDIFDIFRGDYNSDHQNPDSLAEIGQGPFFAILPAAGYALQSGYTGVVSVSTTFLTSHSEQKVSSIQSDFNYSQNHQFWVNTNSLIYSDKLKLSFVGDWRMQSFPTNTYGLGSHSSVSDIAAISYNYIKFHQVALHEMFHDFFLGIGYHYDHYNDIDLISSESGKITDFQKYGLSSSTTSSGISLDLVYDSRTSMVNPLNGAYVSFMYRDNGTALGSDKNWQSIVLDIRKYIPVPGNSNNILAFWSYNNLIIKGDPPYLELPFTAGDPYSNTQRGYVQGRFRGRKFISLESEYRYGILKNGLLGGVFFANIASFSEWPSNQFTGLLPAAGMGLRLKLNKHSNTNLAIDYAVGMNGSRGFFFNIGEVF